MVRGKPLLITALTAASLVALSPAVAAAPGPVGRPQAEWPCTRADECPPKAGFWKPAGDGEIYRDPTGYSVHWVLSQIHEPPKGQIPAWFTVTVEYRNQGTDPASFTCGHVSDPGLSRELFLRQGKEIGHVPADSTSCSKDPSLAFTLNPGETRRLNATFHNVPWSGDRLAIDWTVVRSDLGRRLVTAYIDPYGSYQGAPSKRNDRPVNAPDQAPTKSKAPSLRTTQSKYRFGAFAYSPSNHSVVTDGWGKDKTSAQDKAVEQCRAKADDCIPVAWFANSRAAFAVATGGAWSWGRAETQEQADAMARQGCQAKGGEDCTVTLQHETKDPSAKGKGEDLIGRVCLVSSPDSGTPYGVTLDKNGNVKSVKYYHGHVGWAFLVDRESGQWYYGANEGPKGTEFSKQRKPKKRIKHGGKPLIESRMWWVHEMFDSRATWPGLVATFAGKKYEVLRCQSGNWNNSIAAFEKAKSQQEMAYLPPKSDCLSHAVDVLREYGATSGLAADYVKNFEPNAYFTAELVDFEPSRPLK